MARGWDRTPTPLAVNWLPEDLRCGTVRARRQETDVDPIAYREVVVRRLLDRGIKPVTLTTLLPDWESLIVTVAADAQREDRAS